MPFVTFYSIDKWKTQDNDNDKQKVLRKPLILCDHLIMWLSPYKKNYGIYHMAVQSTIQAY